MVMRPDLEPTQRALLERHLIEGSVARAVALLPRHLPPEVREAFDAVARAAAVAALEQLQALYRGEVSMIDAWHKAQRMAALMETPAIRMGILEALGTLRPPP